MPQEMIHTMRTTCSTLMPEAAASAALSDTARVARPRRVWYRKMVTPIITRMAMPAEVRVGASVVIGPSWKLGGTDLVMPLISPPKKNWKTYCNAIDRPIVTIICCMVPTRLRRSGTQISSFWRQSPPQRWRTESAASAAAAYRRKPSDHQGRPAHHGRRSSGRWCRRPGSCPRSSGRASGRR